MNMKFNVQNVGGMVIWMSAFFKMIRITAPIVPLIFTMKWESDEMMWTPDEEE